MFIKAPRLPGRFWQCLARGVWLAAALLAGHASADSSRCVSGGDGHLAEVCYQNVTGTAPYGHGVLGDTPEWERLVVRALRGPAAGRPSVFTAPRQIFEDIAPRLIDLDFDGRDEIVTVQSSISEGARLAIFRLTDSGQLALISATPYIGRPFRWLAPAGAADLDNDGHIELAYVDRPHLAKTLRIWRFKNDALSEVARLAGVSNHKIGWPFIIGGIRTCGAKPTIIVADGGWSKLLAVDLVDGTLEARRLGP
ncbi:MAG: VCBS repeat-containing protein [Rhodobacteraceae bacterium]|nr:VCBS repeat-containing protein [Paracoccaceae bacterium]